MAPDAPSGPAVAVGHAVPSGFTHPGSAIASGAAAIIAAAAPARTADVREIFFSAMYRVYPPGEEFHSRIDAPGHFADASASRELIGQALLVRTSQNANIKLIEIARWVVDQHESGLNPG